jgi:hypothetical protein
MSKTATNSAESLFSLAGFFRAEKVCRIPSFGSGTDVMIFKIFSPKNLAKILAFFVQTTASFDFKN